jgi:hypothetical protein
MFAAFFILAALIGVAPELLVVHETIVDGLILAIVAIGVAIVALNISPRQAGRLLELLRPVSVIALIPAAWMLFQIAPVSIFGLAHPAWTSTAATLERTIAGTISIDPGATLLSLSRYFCFTGIVLLSTAVNIDRDRAGLILLLLTGVSVLIAAELISRDLGHFGWLFGQLRDPVNHVEALSSSALGVILSTSLGIRAFERYERRPRVAQGTVAKLAVALVAYTAAFVICLWALLANGDRILFFGASYGLATLIGIAAMRRFGAGPWGKLGFVSLAILGAVGFVVTTPGIQDDNLTLVWSSSASNSVAITQRIMSDVPWTGTGAGTFEFLIPIYRVSEEPVVATAPTAGASIAVEMGRPMLVVFVVVVLYVVLMLANGALRRGRDFFYPAAGAGCLVMLLSLAFDNTGVLGKATSTLAGAVLGLALAQSRTSLSGKMDPP